MQGIIGFGLWLGAYYIAASIYPDSRVSVHSRTSRSVSTKSQSRGAPQEGWYVLSTFISKYCLQNPFYELVYESAHPALLVCIVCWKNIYTFIRMLNTRCISKLLKIGACCIGRFPFSLFDLVKGLEGIFRIFCHY